MRYKFLQSFKGGKFFIQFHFVSRSATLNLENWLHYFCVWTLWQSSWCFSFSFIFSLYPQPRRIYAVDAGHSKNHNEGIFTNGWALTLMSTLFPLLSLHDVHQLEIKWWTILRGRKDSISLQCNYTRLSGNNYRVVLIFYKLRINGIREWKGG